MAEAIKKITRRTTTKSVAVIKETNKHRLKVAKLSKEEGKTMFVHSLKNIQFNSNSLKDLEKELNDCGIMYFDIPNTDTIEFPKDSSEFFDLFWVLSKKYATFTKTKDGIKKVCDGNKYRSLGEIYLTYKFYYSKLTFSKFLKVFFSRLDEDIKQDLLSDDQNVIECIETKNNPHACLSTLVCTTINRRVYSVKSISQRVMNRIDDADLKDEFGFYLKDYLNQ